MTPFPETFNRMTTCGEDGSALPARIVSSAAPLSNIVALVSAVALAACGGGGDPAATRTPTPQIQPIPAQMTVPDPVGYDADHLAAFDRINELRLAAGLGMMAQNPAIDRASQAHADWEFENSAFSHVEAKGTPGFTGVTWSDRLAAQGYDVNDGSEALAMECDPTECVDVLFNAVYHRATLLTFRLVDVGIGWHPGTRSFLDNQFAMDFAWPDDASARSSGQGPQPSIGGVVVWPSEGASSVRLTNGNETPNPVPGIRVTDLGTAASINVDEGISIEVDTFSMRRQADNFDVDAVLLTAANDPNHVTRSSFVALVPLSRLDANTKYLVSFQASLKGPMSSDVRAIAKAWSFTTGSGPL